MKNKQETPDTFPRHKLYPYATSLLMSATQIMTSPKHKTPSKANMVYHTFMTTMAAT